MKRTLNCSTWLSLFLILLDFLTNLRHFHAMIVRGPEGFVVQGNLTVTDLHLMNGNVDLSTRLAQQDASIQKGLNSLATSVTTANNFVNSVIQTGATNYAATIQLMNNQFNTIIAAIQNNFTTTIQQLNAQYLANVTSLQNQIQLLQTQDKTKIQTFTASGIYTPTPGMISCIIEVLGGGGGGGGAAATNSATFAAGAGGGAGEYARGVFTAANIGVASVVTIGAAGAAGPAGSNYGGNGGVASAGNSLSGGLAGTGGFGGSVRTPGSAGGECIVHFSSVVASGQGANGLYGAGGGSVNNGFSAGNAGLGFGSGGSGGENSYSQAFGVAGGAGTSGYVVITEFF